MHATATISFEIEISVSGSFIPGCEAWGGSRFERPINPPEPDRVEDVDIEDIGVIELVPAPTAERGSHPRGVWKTTSLMDGVDRNCPGVRRLIQNILAMKQQEAEEALAEGVSE